MDYTEFTSVKNKFTANPNLCDLFKLLAIETWKRIEYGYLKPGIKVFETTITQNLIFSINAYRDQFNLNIEIFEALNEKVNGNDFELLIRFPNEELEYYAPVQAKKIYRSGKYISMDHGAQIESLRTYALSKDAKPFYLLYNFTTTPLREGIVLSNPMELTGCSFVPAEFLFSNYYNKRTIKKKDGTSRTTWKIPEFYDLHPINAFPWHEVVCPENATGLYKLLQNKGIAPSAPFNPSDITLMNKDLKQGFYPLGTIKNDEWINVKELVVSEMKRTESIGRIVNEVDKIWDPKSIQKISESQISSYEKEKVYPDFSPKSRIVLSKPS
jgi:hypothetical protein